MQRFISLAATLFLAGSLCFSKENNQPDEQNFSLTQASSKAASEAPDLSILESSSKKAIESKSTKITIDSSVPSAQVFLNGQYEGNTSLTISSLPAGTYNLRVEKKGYKTKRYRIHVRSGEYQHFYIELEKLQGTLNISLYPPETTVTIDGTKISASSVKLEEGEHLVKAQLFGWESIEDTISIQHDSIQLMTITLTPAQFYLSELRSSKKSFNPSLPGSAGKANFNFYVTNKETGYFSVCNSLNEEIYSSELPEFSTWTQKILWDGTDSTGSPAPEGIYTAKITAGNFSQSTSVSIDYSITIPAATITASGSGIGVLPAAFHYPAETFIFSINSGTVFSTGEKSFYGSPVYAAAAYIPVPWFEISLKGGLLAGHNGVSEFLSGAGKFSFQKKISGNYTFDSAIIIRSGGSANAPYEPYGCDNGYGFGGGLVLGLESPRLYTGFSSEVTYATSTWSTDTKDTVCRNGFSLQYKNALVAAGIFGAINSSFGHTDSPLDDRTGNCPLRCGEAGFDISLQPDSSVFFINLRSSCKIYKSKKYYNAEAGFTVLM